MNRIFRLRIYQNSLLQKLDLYISAWTGALYEQVVELDVPISPFQKMLNMVRHFSAIEMEKRLGFALFEIKSKKRFD